MRSLLTSLSELRRHLPPPARRAVRSLADPTLNFVGSVAGARGVLDQVALTFDDGPDPGSTREVVSALSEAGVHATFFMLSSRARRYPEVVRAVVDAGHEVGLHGPDHRRLTHLTEEEARSSVRDAKHVLEDLIGAPVQWFRPPFGSQTVRTVRVMRGLGLDPVVWTTEGEDWVVQPTARIAERVSQGATPGGVILLHDALAGDPSGPPTVDPLQAQRGEIAGSAVWALREMGLEPTTLSRVVRAGRIHRTAWFRP